MNLCVGVRRHCGFDILECSCCVITMGICVGVNLSTILPHCTVTFQEVHYLFEPVCECAVFVHVHCVSLK